MVERSSASRWSPRLVAVAAIFGLFSALLSFAPVAAEQPTTFVNINVTAIGVDPSPAWTYTLTSDTPGCATRPFVVDVGPLPSLISSFNRVEIAVTGDGGAACVYVVNSSTVDDDWTASVVFQPEPSQSEQELTRFTASKVETTISVLQVEQGAGVLTLLKTRLTDQVGASTVTVTGDCLAEPVVVAIELFEPAPSFTQGFAVVPTTADNGSRCDYDVSVATPDGVVSSVGELSPFFLNSLGYPESQVQVVKAAVGDGTMVITKSVGAESATDAGPHEFTVTSTCLDAPIVVETGDPVSETNNPLFNGGDGGIFTFEVEVTVPSADSAGVLCEYFVTQKANAAFAEAGGPTMLGPVNVFAFDNGPVRVVIPFGPKIQVDIAPTGSITIQKTATGDSTNAPDEWVFEISGECLDSPVRIEMASAATFVETSTVVVDDLPVVGGCSYTVEEIVNSPLFNVQPSPSQFAFLGTDFPDAVFDFVNVGPGPSPLRIFKTVFAASIDEVGSHSFVINSECLASDITVATEGEPVPIPLAPERTDNAWQFEIAVELLSHNAAGEPCDYYIAQVDNPDFVGGVFFDGPYRVGSAAVFEPSVGSAKAAAGDVTTAAVQINKDAFGDRTLAPALWEFTITGECIDEPIVVEMPSGPTFDATQSILVDLVAVGPNGFCPYQFTETPASPFLTTDTQTLTLTPLLSGGPFPVFFENYGPGSTGAIRIDKSHYTPVGANIPTSTFEISSVCLDEPILVDSSPPDFVSELPGGSLLFSSSTLVDNLPIVVPGDIGCVMDVTQIAENGVLLLNAPTQSVRPSINAQFSGSNAFFSKTDFAAPLDTVVTLAKQAYGDTSNIAAWEFDVASDCLDDNLTALIVPGGASSVSLQLPYQRNGTICEYTISEVPAPPFVDLTGPVTLNFRDNPPIVTFVNAAPGTAVPSSPIVIEKFNFANSFNEVPTTQFTLTSTCLSTPLTVETGPFTTEQRATQSFTTTAVVDNLLAFDDTGAPCTYLVEQVPSDQAFPSAGSVTTLSVTPPVIGAAAPVLRFGTKISANTGGGTIEIVKSATGDRTAAPANWTFTITSACLDAPIIALIDTTATFDDTVIEPVNNLPLTDANGFCTYTITETAVAGFTASPATTTFDFTANNTGFVRFTNTQQPPTPVPSPTAVPTSEPTAVPTSEPTAVPTSEPTAVPTSEPTAVPTSEPTAVPTSEPTQAPALSLTDPYICSSDGGRLNGTISGGVAPYTLVYSFTGPMLTGLAPLQITTAGDYTTPPGFVATVATNPGTYEVIAVLTDATGNTAMVSFNADIGNCLTPADLAILTSAAVSPVQSPATSLPPTGVTITLPAADFGGINIGVSAPVVTSPQTNRQALAFTGSNLLIAQFALLAIALGALILGSPYRRRTQS